MNYNDLHNLALDIEKHRIPDPNKNLTDESALWNEGIEFCAKYIFGLAQELKGKETAKDLRKVKEGCEWILTVSQEAGRNGEYCKGLMDCISMLDGYIKEKENGEVPPWIKLRQSKNQNQKTQ